MPAMIYNGKIYGASSTLADDIIYDNTNSGLRAGTVGDAIDELAINGVGSYLNPGEEREMLWQNPSMDSLVHNTPVAAQSISIPNLTSYKAIDILVYALIGTNGSVFPETFRIDSLIYNKSIELTHGHDTVLYARHVDITENEIAFGGGYQGSASADHRMIPIAIYGIKESSGSNSNLGVRYNAETDMLEIFYNNQWNEWKVAGIQKFNFITGTILSDWSLTDMSLAYASDVIETMTFTSTALNSSASTTKGNENTYAISKNSVLIKQGDKLKVTGDHVVDGTNSGTWIAISISTDGINFNLLTPNNVENYDLDTEFDLSTYAGSEVYIKFGMRAANKLPSFTFSRFEIAQ